MAMRMCKKCNGSVSSSFPHLILCKRLALQYRDFLDRFIRRRTGSTTKKSHLALSDISWISLTFLSLLRRGCVRIKRTHETSQTNESLNILET